MECHEDLGEDGLQPVEPASERRQAYAILWAKFGKYMCQQLAQNDLGEDGGESSRPATYVRFYQRLGAVGVWGFNDGCFQVSPASGTGRLLSLADDADAVQFPGSYEIGDLA